MPLELIEGEKIEFEFYNKSLIVTNIRVWSETEDEIQTVFLEDITFMELYGSKNDLYMRIASGSIILGLLVFFLSNKFSIDLYVPVAYYVLGLILIIFLYLYYHSFESEFRIFSNSSNIPIIARESKSDTIYVINCISKCKCLRISKLNDTELNNLS